MPSKTLFFPLVPCLSNNKKERDRSFLDNGSILLEDLIASCDGKSNPIRCYSAADLIRATNNFDPSRIIQDCSAPEYKFHHSIHVYGGYKMFRGLLDGRSIIIKKFMATGDEARSMAIRDIIILMQMSNHKNVLKLLGCCLEIPIPALVHEYAIEGVLNDQGGLRTTENQSSLPWKTRLRIAIQLASAITYLHTAFPRPIIHRALKPSSIFLDHDYAPKLSNFGLSITIPPMKSHADDEVKGTFGFLDPSYMKSGYILEKSDVYSFGVLLLVFLTGQKAVDAYEAGEYQSIIAYVKASDIGQIQTIADPKILGEVGGDEQARRHLHDFLALALLCTQEESEVRPDMRPDMMDVAKELLRIEKSIISK
ncbi:non-functional pseudokinase ZED1-like [Prunus dulcis]|uniref:non-functional pseudokinase ZED1-like n=1 Tax=Prunus dulcis TaxID=3755 RepID=UPI001482B9D0|nr:non-functional pseudokinase ZED1-like [Prunus dulcis]